MSEQADNNYRDHRDDYNRGLLDFIDHSPTPFHCVEQMVTRLEAKGFQRLHEADRWQLAAEQCYYVTRNDSSLIAFRCGSGDVCQQGIRMVGAHTDSPCLKVKPQPEINKKGYFQLGVEVYGGALLNPWFDRDLSLAGRVGYLDGEGALHHATINFVKALAVIPSLAIHLDRSANKERSINAQNHLPPLVALAAKSGGDDFRALLLQQLSAEHPEAGAQQILDYELCFYDTQAAAVVGLRDEFIAAARLDNLLSCYVGMTALLEVEGQGFNLLVCNDHEEVGSLSACGAQGPFLKSVLQRLCGSAEQSSRALSRSLLVSADNAHGVHPNFADKHDEQHGPLLNGGPVIKSNANQRYATNSRTSSLFRRICEQQQVPLQAFVVRSDMACGSTIGPITAGEIGVDTVDVGVPTFAMHSIRELAGAADPLYFHQALRCFYTEA
ncbi:MAG: M18 family aminopeptidase [Gammaproteobacteria bacterium]|nr:M18 family aminopeptidase [Gammaproteobacteria bacterium]